MFNAHRCSKQSWLRKGLCIAQGSCWLLQHMCEDASKQPQAPWPGLRAGWAQLAHRSSPTKQCRAGSPRTCQCKHLAAVAQLTGSSSQLALLSHCGGQVGKPRLHGWSLSRVGTLSCTKLCCCLVLFLSLYFPQSRREGVLLVKTYSVLAGGW